MGQRGLVDDAPRGVRLALVRETTEGLAAAAAFGADLETVQATSLVCEIMSHRCEQGFPHPVIGMDEPIRKSLRAQVLSAPAARVLDPYLHEGVETVQRRHPLALIVGGMPSRNVLELLLAILLPATPVQQPAHLEQLLLANVVVQAPLQVDVLLLYLELVIVLRTKSHGCACLSHLCEEWFVAGQPTFTAFWTASTTEMLRM